MKWVARLPSWAQKRIKHESAEWERSVVAVWPVSESAITMYSCVCIKAVTLLNVRVGFGAALSQYDVRNDPNHRKHKNQAYQTPVDCEKVKLIVQIVHSDVKFTCVIFGMCISRLQSCSKPGNLQNQDENEKCRHCPYKRQHNRCYPLLRPIRQTCSTNHESNRVVYSSQVFRGQSILLALDS